MITQTAIPTPPYCTNCGRPIGINFIKCPDCNEPTPRGHEGFTVASRTSSANSAFDWTYEGEQHLKNEDFEKAIAAFTNSIEINPNLTSAYAKRSEAYQAMGQDELAAADKKSLDAVVASRRANPGFAERGKDYESYDEESNPQGQMVTGVLWIAGGLLATAISYEIAAPGGAYFVFWGAVIWGTFTCVSGLIGMLRR